MTYAILKVGEEAFASRVKVATTLEEGSQFLGCDGGHGCTLSWYGRYAMVVIRSLLLMCPSRAKKRVVVISLLMLDLLRCC